MCLVERDCDITLGDDSGTLPIHLAAAHDRLSCIRFLVGQSVSPESTNNAGKTPMHMVGASVICFLFESLHFIADPVLTWHIYILCIAVK